MVLSVNKIAEKTSKMNQRQKNMEILLKLYEKDKCKNTIHASTTSVLSYNPHNLQISYLTNSIFVSNIIKYFLLSYLCLCVLFFFLCLLFFLLSVGSSNVYYIFL